MGEAINCFNRMVSGMERLNQIREHVESDVMNLEKYVKEMVGGLQGNGPSQGST